MTTGENIGGVPGGQLELTGAAGRGWGFGRQTSEVEPVGLINLDELGPQVAEHATSLLEEYVDPLITQAPIGEWIRKNAQFRVMSVWVEGAEARQGDMHGYSERKARNNPDALAETRNAKVMEFAQEAGRIGVSKIIDLGISPAQATQNAFGLLGVETYHSPIDGFRIADGKQVAVAIERATEQIGRGYDDLSPRGSEGVMLARNDTSWTIHRDNKETGKSADTVFLVADEREDIHYIAATQQISVQAPGMEEQTRNKVTAFALNPKIASRAVQAMQTMGSREIVARGNVNYEVLTSVREDLKELNEWSSKASTIGRRAEASDQGGTTSNVREIGSGASEGTDKVVDAQVVDGQ